MPIAESNKPGIAAVLSLIIPGMGQFYNGTFWRGIFWLIITPGLWIGSGGILGGKIEMIRAGKLPVFQWKGKTWSDRKLKSAIIQGG